MQMCTLNQHWNIHNIFFDNLSSYNCIHDYYVDWPKISPLAAALLLKGWAHDHDHYSNHSIHIQVYTSFQQKNIHNTSLNNLFSYMSNLPSSYDLHVLTPMIDPPPALCWFLMNLSHRHREEAHGSAANWSVCRSRWRREGKRCRCDYWSRWAGVCCLCVKWMAYLRW